ncbi:MAG: ASCH domain-containing protein [Spirulinaceae cyanobacterium RM2_2_10]|nr:ASCH domain-containing protein [Spirulinaceae cyanobacterium SM2_1_0]NJO19865.1 ASCH domain-containing protein [Spirulinaceae cyanobacterium RM2_2_10]
MHPPAVLAYWQAYQASLGALAAPTELYLAQRFGDTPELADELGQLVLSGHKTATCAAWWEFQAARAPLPSVGLKTIVLDGRDRPLGIIATTEVTLRRFRDVPAEFAYDEGEGDRRLASWQRQHWRYFQRVLPTIGRQPALDMLLVCERFRLLYPAPLP